MPLSLESVQSDWGDILQISEASLKLFAICMRKIFLSGVLFLS